jgi:hypothetical protein
MRLENGDRISDLLVVDFHVACGLAKCKPYRTICTYLSKSSLSIFRIFAFLPATKDTYSYMLRGENLISPFASLSPRASITQPIIHRTITINIYRPINISSILVSSTSAFTSPLFNMKATTTSAISPASASSSASASASSPSSSTGSKLIHRRRNSANATTSTTNTTSTTYRYKNMSIRHHPILLIIIVTFLIVVFPSSPWVVSSSSSSSSSTADAEEFIAQKQEGRQQKQNPIPEMLGGLFDKVKNVVVGGGKNKGTSSTTTVASSSATTESVMMMTTTTTTTTPAIAEGGDEEQVMDESSRVCSASQNGNTENCSSEFVVEVGEVTGQEEAAESAATGVIPASDHEVGGSDAITTEPTTAESLAEAEAEASPGITMMAPDETVTSVETADDTTVATKEPFSCQDIDEGCENWTQGGTSTDACTLHSAFMTHHCPVSCHTCDVVNFGHRMITTKGLEGGLAIIPFCQDNDYNCKTFADSGECTKNPGYMHVVCEASCRRCAEESNDFGVGQRLSPDNPEEYQLVTDWLKNTVEYMNTIKRDERYAHVIHDCLNLVPDCTFWAAQVRLVVRNDLLNFLLPKIKT